jgi:hypothetical protein
MILVNISIMGKNTIHDLFVLQSSFQFLGGCSVGTSTRLLGVALSAFLQLESTIQYPLHYLETIVDSSCKKSLVICNSIFSIVLNQIKAQKDQKIIVWIEYFP